jgi:hypothetical protein
VAQSKASGRRDAESTFDDGTQPLKYLDKVDKVGGFENSMDIGVSASANRNDPSPFTEVRSTQGFVVV